MKKLLTIPYTFTMLHWASVTGLYYFLVKEGRAQDVWLRYQEPSGKQAR